MESIVFSMLFNELLKLTVFYRINGKELFVGLSSDTDYEEAKSIKKGSVITVKHQGMNVHGTLQYPKFYRERTDVKWNDLINI